MKDAAALQRENKLMTSAWFDLSSRIQSNTVMVGRRKESPKSFLGKQRVVVTPLIVAGQVGHNMPSRMDDTDHVLASTVIITTDYARRLACMDWFEQNRGMGVDGITCASHQVSLACPVYV